MLEMRLLVDAEPFASLLDIAIVTDDLYFLGKVIDNKRPKLPRDTKYKEKAGLKRKGDYGSFESKALFTGHSHKGEDKNDHVELGIFVWSKGHLGQSNIAPQNRLSCQIF